MFTWLISWMREQRRSKSELVLERVELRIALLRSAVYLLIIFTLHTLAMLGLEGMSFGDALWLTLTTVTTVGYGDLSAATFGGRAATVTLMYMGGIFVLAKVAGDYFEYRAEKRLRKLRGEWDWHMQGHILIINTPTHSGEPYFQRLFEQFRASDRYADHPIQILTTMFPDGLPKSLARQGSVVHYHGTPDDPDSLVAVTADKADAIVVLATDETDPASDSRTFDILHRLRELGVQGRVLAECVDDRNRPRLLNAGASIVVRPVRAYPEMVVRGFVAPGSERVIENMFTSSSDEYLRFDIPISGRPWKDIVCAMIKADLGTAVAYVATDDGELHCNPPAAERVDATGVILMVREDRKPSEAEVQQALNL